MFVDRNNNEAIAMDVQKKLYVRFPWKMLLHKDYYLQIRFIGHVASSPWAEIFRQSTKSIRDCSAQIVIFPHLTLNCPFFR